MKITAFGKWILAGEHAVLRGHRSLVFPLFSRKIEFNLQRESAEFFVKFSGTHGTQYELLFYGVLERAMEILKKSWSERPGQTWELVAELPLGAGLGASAALCVSVVKLLGYWGWVPESRYFELSRELENSFHGASSGVDIAVNLSASPLLFDRHGFREQVELGWNPLLALSDSGAKGLTRECIERVAALREKNLSLADQVDQRMAEVVERSFRILTAQTKLQSEADLLTIKLGEELKKAQSCFQDWGLISEPLEGEFHRLQSLGAIAVKPTGSGIGGFVLSLWPQSSRDVLKRTAEENRLILI